MEAEHKYSITVAGHLGSAGRAAFDGLDITEEPADGMTSIRGSLDQAALFGVLHRVQALAIVLVEVRRIT